MMFGFRCLFSDFCSLFYRTKAWNVLLWSIVHLLIFFTILFAWSLTARGEFPSAKGVMDGFGGADLTIPKIRNKIKSWRNNSRKLSKIQNLEILSSYCSLLEVLVKFSTWYILTIATCCTTWFFVMNWCG